MPREYGYFQREPRLDGCESQFHPGLQSDERRGNGECGPNLNATFGNPNPADDIRSRDLEWMGCAALCVGVFGQRAAANSARLSANFAFYQRINGNFTVTDNLATASSDFRTFSMPGTGRFAPA